MDKLFLRFVIILIILSSVSCTQASPSAINLPGAPTPSPDKATVTGHLVSIAGENGLENQLIRLAKIFGEGKDSLYFFDDSSSPGTYTDINGFFVFKDIEPGSYAVLIQDANGSTYSIKENEDKVVTVEAIVGQVSNIIELKVDINNLGK